MPPVRLATIRLNSTLNCVVLLPDLLGTIHGASDLLTYGGGKALKLARAAIVLGGQVQSAPGVQAVGSSSGHA